LRLQRRGQDQGRYKHRQASENLQCFTHGRSLQG
jgi:hypothetical protein